MELRCRDVEIAFEVKQGLAREKNLELRVEELEKQLKEASPS